MNSLAPRKYASHFTGQAFDVAGEMTKARRRISFEKLDVLQHRRKAALIKNGTLLIALDA